MLMKNNRILIKKYRFLALILMLAGSVHAQSLLTLEDAVKIALENNYAIRIARNDAQVSQTNVAIGNAGMLPKVTASFTDSNGIQHLSQTRADGTVNSVDNAHSSNINYGANLDWTIFDGFKMFARYDQLKALQQLGESQMKLKILDRIGAVNTMYFDLVQQQLQLSALDTALVISKQRLTLAQNRFSIGKASKLEVLNAQVDLNADTSALLKQKELFAQTKTQLNQLLARDITTDFKVAEDIQVDPKLNLSELTALAQKQNPQLESLLISKKVAELQLKQTKANRYPTVKVNTGYNFSEAKSELGFTTQSSARGLNYGLSATLNLFDGNSQNRNEKIAKLTVENSKLALEEQQQALQTQLALAYQTYQTQLQLSELEEKNVQIAQQNLNITLDKFRIGTITTFEFRTAQLNFVEAKTRYSNTLFQAKLAEIGLRELAGNLTF
ncbi:MAG: TolC family protein [Bacteroidetes bacterium]|nr:TolC family protein [Bacteroidota bacterium]